MRNCGCAASSDRADDMARWRREWLKRNGLPHPKVRYLPGRINERNKPCRLRGKTFAARIRGPGYLSRLSAR